MQKERLEFITFVGIPASGKSTEAEKYRQKGYKVYSSDEVRAEVEKKVELGEMKIAQNSNLNATVFEIIQERVAQTLKSGISVVFDATNLGRKRRMNFKKCLYKIDCEKICVLFITPIEECYKRNALREGNARVPEEAMQRMLCSFECPNYWEGWDKIIPVVSDKPYKFDFEQIIGFSQDNPHHTLTLDGHINRAYEIAVEKGYNKTVQKVLKYHDAGKFYTKRFENFRGEKTETAHYYGHENYGAYLYLTENCCGKTVSQEDFDQILYETNLINCHMRPLTVWKNSLSAKEKDKKLFGEQFFNDLISLNECDRLAH